MGPNSGGNRFQWDSKPVPNTNMSLAEIAQGKGNQGSYPQMGQGQNMMPGYPNYPQNRPPNTSQGGQNLF